MKLIPAQFLRGSFLSVLAAVSAGVAGYLTRRFMANHLPENDYAFFYSTYSLITFLLILTQVGLSDVMLFELPGLLSLNRKAKAGGFYSFVCRIQSLLALIFFLLLCASIPFLKKYYYSFPVSTANLLLLFTILWGLTLENTTLFALNSVRKFGTTSLLRSLKALLICAGVILCLWMKSFVGIILFYVLITTGCTLAGHVLFRKNLPQSALLRPPQKKKIFIDGGIFIFLAVGSAVIQDLGTVSTAFFSSAAEVVLFNIALPIAMIVNSFTAVLQVFMPMIADCFAQKEKKKLKHLFMLVILGSSVCMLVVLPILWFGGDFIIRLLFSEKFIAAKLSTIWLVEASILSLPVRAFLNFFNTIGKQNVSVITLIPTAVSAMILFPLLSWKFGAVGAAEATFFAALIWLAGYFWCFYRFMREWKV